MHITAKSTRQKAPGPAAFLANLLSTKAMSLLAQYRFLAPQMTEAA